MIFLSSIELSPVNSTCIGATPDAMLAVATAVGAMLISVIFSLDESLLHEK